MDQSLLPPISTWTLAARPRTLPAAAAPVIVSIALAVRDGVFDWAPALTCLLISLLLQIGANYANDLFDHERGNDTPDRIGPTRVTASGMISPAQMRLGLVIIFGLAALLGLYLTWLRGWPVVALGLATILAALAYSGGPFPYGYYALGDVFVFLFFGMAAVCGTYYVQAGTLTPVVAWAAVPMGLLIVNILVVNNTRDIGADSESKKRTLAVLFGRKTMLMEYLVCLIGAYLVPLGLAVLGDFTYGGLLTWISMPLAIQLYREFARKNGRQLNKTLGGTAQLALVYAVLLSLGILVHSLD